MLSYRALPKGVLVGQNDSSWGCQLKHFQQNLGGVIGVQRTKSVVKLQCGGLWGDALSVSTIACRGKLGSSRTHQDVIHCVNLQQYSRVAYEAGGLYIKAVLHQHRRNECAYVR